MMTLTLSRVGRDRLIRILAPPRPESGSPSFLRGQQIGQVLKVGVMRAIRCKDQEMSLGKKCPGLFYVDCILVAGNYSLYGGVVPSETR